MRKLVLLLFLIPVLSWADCPNNPEIPFIEGFSQEHHENLKKQAQNIHCEIHRCFDEQNKTIKCVCKNLGGYQSSDGLNYFCINAPLIHFDLDYIKENHFYTFMTTKPKIKVETNLDDAKSQCEELGFTPKTEKFGECVLELTK